MCVTFVKNSRAREFEREPEGEAVREVRPARSEEASVGWTSVEWGSAVARLCPAQSEPGPMWVTLEKKSRARELDLEVEGDVVREVRPARSSGTTTGWDSEECGSAVARLWAAQSEEGPMWVTASMKDRTREVEREVEREEGVEVGGEARPRGEEGSVGRMEVAGGERGLVFEGERVAKMVRNGTNGWRGRGRWGRRCWAC